MDNISVDKIRQNLGHRAVGSHKGDYGKVLLVAGSIGMAGAAVLAGRSTYFAGAGLVTCDVPEKLFPILQISLPEAICVPRKLGKTNYAQYDSIILGPGLDVNKESGSMVEEILNTYTGPLVIDADGINCISQYNLYQNLLDTNAQVILTPHPGEGKRLMGVEEIIDRESFAVSMAQTFGVTAVLKGAGTLVASMISDHQMRVLINPTGNPGMATAGSGDVLSGIIGAFTAKGLSTLDAAAAGVYIHGAAGDMAAKEIGETGMIASDISRFIPMIIKNITGK